jgi:hypothetical protein
MAKPDETTGRHSFQLVGARESREAPLVEPFAADPPAGGKLPRPRRDFREKRRDTPHLAEVELGVAGGQREEMEVRIDEAREERRAAAVEALDARPDEAAEIRRASDRLHAAGADHEARGDGARRVERQDPGVLEEPVGGRQSDEGSGFASFSFIS